MTKYKAIFNEVREVEIVSETEKQVTLKELNWIDKPIREKKESNWFKYCDTYEEAVQFLVNLARSEVDKYERYLKQSNDKLERAKSLFNKKGGE